LDFAHADLRFGQEPQSAAKTELEVDTGPFAAFKEKKTASAMQKFIVPWNIALHGLSYAKKMTNKDIKAQLIAVIDSENLMPGHLLQRVPARQTAIWLARNSLKIAYQQYYRVVNTLKLKPYYVFIMFNNVS
jgi:hypothetical protein